MFGYVGVLRFLFRQDLPPQMVVILLVPFRTHTHVWAAMIEPRSSSREVIILRVPDLFSVADFSRGTLPPKRGEKGTTRGPSNACFGRRPNAS